MLDQSRPETETTLRDLIARGEIGPERARALYGLDQRDGTPWYGKWEELFPLFVYAGPGGGKSALLANYAAQGTFCGMRALVIDPVGHMHRQSLTGRLSPLAFTLLEPAATDVDAARRVLDRLRVELSDRQAARGEAYPLLFMVEELAMMRHEWSEVREDILRELERIALEGRKYRVFCAASSHPSRDVAERVDGPLGYVKTRFWAQSAIATAL